MTQCSFINQTKVQKLHGYQTRIELLLAMNFFEIPYNIIRQVPKALRTTGGLPKWGRTENVFQLLFFNLASYPAGRY